MMDRNSCILPSNAPSLQDSIIDEIGVPRPILQERCNNRQQDFLDPDQQKPPYLDAYYNGAAQTYLPSSHSSHANYASTFLGDETDERVRREAIRLWGMLQRSDSYRKYRLRQPKECSREQEQKWPERMEAAFFSALVKYPPMGRGKQMHEGKPRGRNELIADAIEKWTGESRTRKQVSSHIQVLKPYFKDHPKVMRYMSKENLTDRRAHRRHDSADMLRRRMGPQASMRPLDFNSIDQGAVYPPLQHTPLPPPHQMLSSNVLPSPNVPSLVPACFEMNARDTTRTPPRSLHCFTRFSKRAEQPGLYITDAHQTTIPKHLKDILDDKTLSCDVILAESSIELMAQQISKDSTELGIQIEFNSSYDHAHYDRFESHTQFYSGNELATAPIKSTLGYDMNYKRLHAVGGTFGSGFWAGKLGDLSSRMRSAYKQASKLMPARGAAQAEDEEVKRAREHANNSLRALSAVQEIFAVPRSGYEAVERILVVGWTFRHAEPGAGGETCWRRLLLPHQQAAAAAATAACKEDQSLKQDVFGSLKHEAYGSALGLDIPGSALITPSSTQHNAFDQHSFELDPLSSMGFSTGMPLSVSADVNAGASAPPPPLAADSIGVGGVPQDTNGLDFGGGHINVWMEPAVSMQGYYDMGAAPPHSHTPLDQHGVPGPPPHQPQTPVYDQMGAYPRQYGGWNGIMDADIYGHPAGGYADATAATQGYEVPHAHMKEQAKHGLGGGHYLEQPMPGGRRDSGMLGL